MFVKFLIFTILISTLSTAGNVGIEHSGVMITLTTVDKEQKNYVIKRNIPDECKHVLISNTMLWTENFAHNSVPERCKSTYVHTTGKLLSMKLDVDVETYGELEVLYFIKEMQHNDQMVLLDSRTSKWFKYRTIPGAINMPFNYFEDNSDYEFHFQYALKYLGVFIQKDGEFDFSDAKTLLLFCNGPWCNQSPRMIFALMKIGYPPEKLKWYRGGMQDWLGAGMTSTREVSYKSTSHKEPKKPLKQ